MVVVDRVHAWSLRRGGGGLASIGSHGSAWVLCQPLVWHHVCQLGHLCRLVGHQRVQQDRAHALLLVAGGLCRI